MFKSVSVVPLVLAVLLLLPGTIQNVLQAYLIVYFNSQATTGS